MSHILYLKLIHNAGLSRLPAALATEQNTHTGVVLIFVRLSDWNLYKHIPDVSGYDGGIRVTFLPGHFWFC